LEFAEAIGKSSGQALTAIANIFKSLNLNIIDHGVVARRGGALR
jgi:hypothetical protein